MNFIQLTDFILYFYKFNFLIQFHNLYFLFSINSEIKF
jgi:hypothetical protein